jgi:malate/lactate dehydrogenase
VSTEGSCNASISPYFAQLVVFGKKGVEELLPIGELSDYEKGRLAAVVTQLGGEISSGLNYAAK